MSSHSFCFVFLPVLHFARVSETIVSVKWNLDPCTASPNPPSTSIRAIARRFAQDYEGNSRRQPENWTGPNASTGPSSASLFKEKQDEHWKSPTQKCLGYWHSHQQANGVNVFDKTINSRFHEGGLEAPQSLNVLENVRAWRIRSAEKNVLVFWHFHLKNIFITFYDIQLQKKYSQMCWLTFSQIYWELHSKFTHIHLFLLITTTTLWLQPLKSVNTVGTIKHVSVWTWFIKVLIIVGNWS